MPETMGTWEDALPRPGQRVQVDFEPGCEGEAIVHGYQPTVQGKQGVIEKHHLPPVMSGPMDHHIWVKMDEPLSELAPDYCHQWFKLTELRPVFDD